MQIGEILALAQEVKASDIHLTVGTPPCIRLNGKIIRSTDPDFPGELSIKRPLLPQDIRLLVEQIMSPQQWERFERTGDIDFSYALPQVGRFRVNAYKQRGNIGMVLRTIPFNVPSFEELKLPEVLASLSRRPNGLVLVTGPTGSGKSTTLAAMIDLINRERACHIITLEDPIEFLHKHQKSVVNQREIGLDSGSFAAALRAALRQDPDVILVGEMRDLETISIALTAAETGHLVFATLHTNDAVQTLDRIIDAFPPEQHTQIRVQLSTVIQGVVSQQLLLRSDGKGRALAQEIMVSTSAIRNLIREGKTHQILSSIQTGAKYGMITMDGALKELVQKRIVTLEEAAKHSADPEAFRRLVAIY